MRRIVIGVVGTLLLFGGIGCQSAKLKDQLADQERMIRDLRQEKASVEDRLRATTDELAAARGDLESERGRAHSLEDELARSKSQGAAPAADGLDQRRRDLERLLQGTEGSVQVRDGDLVISLPGTITFDSGSSKLTSRGETMLRRIVGEIQNRYRDNTISVEGHTDTDPIKKSKFGTNWRLSVERAMAVRDYLEKNGGLDPGRCRVVGYGPYRPLANNSSANGKEKNRRVEIVIVTS